MSDNSEMYSEIISRSETTSNEETEEVIISDSDTDVVIQPVINVMSGLTLNENMVSNQSMTTTIESTIEESQTTQEPIEVDIEESTTTQESIEMEDVSTNREMSRKRMRVNRSYTIEHKLEIIDYYKNCNNVSKTARDKGLRRKNIYDWLAQENKLRALIHNNEESVRIRRTLQKPRNPALPKLDEEVLKWFRIERGNWREISGLFPK